MPHGAICQEQAQVIPQQWCSGVPAGYPELLVDLTFNDGCSDALVDFLGDAYPPAVQAAWRGRRLGRMPAAELAAELRSQPGMLPNALVQAGPTLTAAAWQTQVPLGLLLFQQQSAPDRAGAPVGVPKRNTLRVGWVQGQAP